MHDWAGQRGGYEVVTMEDVRFAMKKLGVSFGAVAELLEGVKVEKQRCAVLVKELRSAMDILEGIKANARRDRALEEKGQYNNGIRLTNIEYFVASHPLSPNI